MGDRRNDVIRHYYCYYFADDIFVPIDVHGYNKICALDRPFCIVHILTAAFCLFCECK